jgi:hypothetical protein
MFVLHVIIASVVMFNILELIMEIVPNYPTIQKPNCRQFPELSMAGFTDALRPDKFTGVHFKRWQYKAKLWLTTMKVFQISKGKPEGTMFVDDQKKFEEANTVFVGCILSILIDRLCDVFMHIKDEKELWYALDAKFGAADAGSELYIMESFHDFKIIRTFLWFNKLMRYGALPKSSNSLSVSYPTSLWRVALLLSCPLHGGTLPQLSNTRDRRYQLKI